MKTIELIRAAKFNAMIGVRVLAVRPDICDVANRSAILSSRSLSRSVASARNVLLYAESSCSRILCACVVRVVCVTRVGSVVQSASRMSRSVNRCECAIAISSSFPIRTVSNEWLCQP